MAFSEFDRPAWPLLAQVSRPSRYSGSEWRPYALPSWDEARGAFGIVSERDMSRCAASSNGRYSLTVITKSPVKKAL